MTNFVYPVLPGLTYNSVRSVKFNTGKQAALSGKESRIAYQLYPLMRFDLTYELLRDYVAPSDLKALVGLFMACQGQYGTFLYSDPVFNSVTLAQFGVADGVTTAYQITATYQNTGGPGGAEIIQNFNGSPLIYVNGVLQTLGTQYTLGATGVVTFVSVPASAAVLAWSGSFYYRVRFDTDDFDVTQFMNNFWSSKKISLQAIKL